MFRTQRTNFDTNHWRPRDTLAAVLLFLATAAFSLWQNMRVAVLWDLGYLLDTSWRIALGQMPYRDFPLAHAPLTFMIQAALIRLAGRHYFIQIAYAAIAGGCATVLTWRIVLRILRGRGSGCGNRAVALLLSAPLTVLGIYSVYPHPIYDCDCTLAVLLAIYLLSNSLAGSSTAPYGCTVPHPRALPGSPATGLRRWGGRARGWETTQIAPLAAGASAVLPLFFKQNIGLPFVPVVAAGMLVLLAVNLRQPRSVTSALRSQPALALAGMIAALIVVMAAIAATAGLGNYFRWTIHFAAQRRLPGLASMLAVYLQPSFVWTLPILAAGLILCFSRFIESLWARLLSFGLIAAPFAGSLIFLLLDDDADERADNLLELWPLLLLVALAIALIELCRGITLRRLIPFLALAAIHGTLLSQQLWGSTYALWPLLVILVGYILAALPARARWVRIRTALVISLTFMVCGALYSASLERLRYVRIPDAALASTHVPALRGMATPGEYLSNFDELIEFAASEIPPGDALLLLPGEDPFYFATGRTPQFPVTLFDPATDPYSAPQLLEEARRRNVRWVIVKRALQINENPMPDADLANRLVQKEFALYRSLRGYDVYRR